MTWAVLDPWVALAKQWQPLLAGLLVFLASIILSAAIITAAKIRAAAKPKDQTQAPAAQDLRSVSEAENGSRHLNTSGDLEKLRSLVRSALSALSAIDSNDDTARSLCNRIAAFQWQHFSLPPSADKNTRDAYIVFLNQFELLRKILRQGWSSTEASSILIQLNANARNLADTLGQRAPAGPERSYSLK